MSTKSALHLYSKNILLVDDVPLFIRFAKDILRREQVNVFTAQSGPEAVSAVKTYKPDLILMDLYMPGGDGDKACREIKSDIRFKSIPIIMVTSSGNPADLSRCLDAGCNEVLQKPLDREKFLEKCKKLLKFPSWSGRRYKIKAPVKFWFDTGEVFTGSLYDISMGGVFIDTDKSFQVDSNLQLEFQLNTGSVYIKCNSRVAWVKKMGSLKKDHPQGMGFEFLDVKMMDILAIQTWIRNTKPE